MSDLLGPVVDLVSNLNKKNFLTTVRRLQTSRSNGFKPSKKEEKETKSDIVYLQPEFCSP